jgi:hypothetical protein
MSRTTAAAPTIHVSTTHMLTHGHSMSHFNGNTLNLHLYFDKVEALSTNTSLNNKGKIWHALHYASRENNKL